MNRFDLFTLTGLLWRLQDQHCEFEKAAKQNGAMPAESVLDGTLHLLSEMESYADANQFGNCRSTVSLTRKRLERSRATVNVSTVANDLTHLRKALVDETLLRKFLRIESEWARFIDAPALFGQQVEDAFPSARDDIREAGNCLAADCGTAAVFHLMRVAEHGLRALANDRRVKLPKAGQAIELATWEDLIKELEKAEVAIQGYPKTLARESQYEFFHGAMMQVRAFKNVFRNRFMHTRSKPLSQVQALGVYQDVEQFMKILASRISERRRTPKIWKGYLLSQLRVHG